LLDLGHDGRTIVSFNVNTAKVHVYMEYRTPDPMKRLEAAVWKNVGLNSAGLCCNCLG